MKGEGGISLTRERWSQLRLAEDERDKIEAAARAALKRFIAWRDLNVASGYHECGIHEGLRAGIERLEDALGQTPDPNADKPVRPKRGDIKFITRCGCAKLLKDMALKDVYEKALPRKDGNGDDVRKFRLTHFDEATDLWIYTEIDEAL